MPEHLARRLLAFLCVVSFGVAAAFLLFSDSAPAVFRIVTDGVTETGSRLEEELEIDVIDRPDLPGSSDQVGHAMLWAAGMFVVGTSLRKRVPLLITALAMSAISLLSEFGQSAWSSSRVTQASDAAANIVGIAAATVVLAIALAALRFVFGEDRKFRLEREVSFSTQPSPSAAEVTAELPAIRSRPW